jgi:electron transfer flavoprotein alpha subunit
MPVLAFGEASAGKLARESLEVAAAGAAVADALGEPLVGALVGEDLGAATDQFRGGFETLYLIEGRHYRPYTASAWLAAAHAAIGACSPSVVLFAHTLQTREWVPRLAAQLDAGLVMDCTALAAEDTDVVVNKPVYGGGVTGEFVLRGMPRMATVRRGAFAPRALVANANISRLEVPAPADAKITVLEVAAAAGEGGRRLQDARIVVAGGRGIGGPGSWHYVEEAAAALGAGVACSRPVADAGWVPSSQQVGLSGVNVTPDLYIAIGISGAVQHLAGIGHASIVVAINTDAEADIFTRAHYGIVADYREVLPAFVERVKKLRS